MIERVIKWYQYLLKGRYIFQFIIKILDIIIRYYIL